MKNIDPKLEQKIRKMTDSQIDVLYLLTSQDRKFITTDGISDSVSTTDMRELGGIMSGLSRVKIDSGSLIQSVGRDADGGTRWILNESVVTKNKLKEILDEIRSFLG